MKTLKKIGLIIADESEYVMLRGLAEKIGAARNDFSPVRDIFSHCQTMLNFIQFFAALAW